MKKTAKIRIGTRASKLALAQSEEVKRRLLAAYPDMVAEQFEIVPMTTTGDAIQDKTLSDIGGKGLFTKEIEDALLAHKVDIAVHSMKDMPTILPDGLIIPCLLEREDPRDAFISNAAVGVDGLPLYAIVGTSSLRRGAQIKAYRPDLEIIPFRGNVQTRLRKLSEGVCDATLLAVAGLNRLGMGDMVTCPLPTDVCLPAVAQGAIGVECHQDREDIREMLSKIHHPDTMLCVSAERSLLKTLDGSCRTPIGGLATLQGKNLLLEGMVAKPNGKIIHRRSVNCKATLESAERAGHKLGNILLEMAGENFLVH
ncbi:MAG: hydroxymethylbilane synthase [Alphaproteobacteria bacterium]|nr:hydroxymethylbilane synthase [Alphaproteobacteria bacterium]